MIFNFLKNLFLIKGLTTYFLFEFLSIPLIKSSEIILNEENINLNSFISYARKTHTDNFILVNENGKAYKSCLARIPKGCSKPYIFYGYVNSTKSEEVVQLRKDGSYWCKTSIILAHLEKNHNWNEHNHLYRFWCHKSGWVKSKSP